MYIKYCIVVLTAITNLNFLLLQGIRVSAQNIADISYEQTALSRLNFCSSTILQQQILELSKLNYIAEDELFKQIQIQAQNLQITNQDTEKNINLNGNVVLSTDFLKLVAERLSISLAGTLNSSGFELILLNGAYKFEAKNIVSKDEILHIDNVFLSFCEGKTLVNWGLQAKSITIDPLTISIKSPKIKILGVTFPGPPKLLIYRDGLYANGLLFPEFAQIENKNYLVLPVYLRLRKNISLTTAPWFRLGTEQDSFGLLGNLEWLGRNHSGSVTSLHGKDTNNADIKLNIIQVKGSFKQNYYIDTLYKQTDALEFFNQFHSLLLDENVNQFWAQSNNYLYSEYSLNSKQSRFKASARFSKPFYQLTAFNPIDAYTSYNLQHSYVSKPIRQRLTYSFDNRFTLRNNEINRIIPFEIFGTETRKHFRSKAGLNLNLQHINLQANLGINTLDWQPKGNLATLHNATSGSLTTQYAVFDASTIFFIGDVFMQLKAQHRKIKSDFQVEELTLLAGEQGQPNALLYPFLNTVVPDITPSSMFQLADFAGTDELMIGDRTSIGLEILHNIGKSDIQFSAAQSQLSSVSAYDDINLRQKLGIEDISKITSFQFDVISSKKTFFTLIHSNGWYRSVNIARIKKTSKYYEYYISRIKTDKTRQLNRFADYETVGVTFKPTASTTLKVHHEFSSSLNTAINSEIELKYYGCCAIFSLGYARNHYANLLQWQQYLSDPNDVSAISTLVESSGFKTNFNLKIPLSEYF